MDAELQRKDTAYLMSLVNIMNYSTCKFFPNKAQRASYLVYWYLNFISSSPHLTINNITMLTYIVSHEIKVKDQ